MASLSGVTFSFDASLTASAAAEAVKSRPPSTAVPLGDNTVAVHRGNGVVERVTTDDVSSFLSEVNTDQLQTSLQTRLDMYPRLKNVATRPLQLEGDVFSVPLCRDGVDPSVFVVSDKSSGSYFDLQIFAVNGMGEIKGNVHFNRYTDAGMQHSGDISLPQPLLHFASLPPLSSTTYFVSVVGYRKTRLIEFTNQCPTAVVVGEDALYGVPLSLSEIDVGRSTMAVIAGMRFCASSNSWKVVSIKSRNVNGVDTGVLTAEVRASVRLALRDFEAGLARPASAPEPTSQLGTFVETVSVEAEPLDCTVVCFRERGTTVPSVFASAVTAQHEFGCGARLRPHHKSAVNLPCLFGPCEPGTSALAFGQPVDPEDAFEWPALYRELDASKLVVVVVSTEWLSTVGDACGWKCNCVMIITGDDEIDKACRVGAVMAGPCSMILYGRGEGLFFYGGVDFGLFGERPSFGQDVTRVLEDVVPRWMDDGGMLSLPIDRVVSRADRALLYGDRKIQLDEIPTGDLSMVASCPKTRAKWVDVCAQLCMMLKPSELQTVSEMLRKAVNKAVDEAVERATDGDIDYSNLTPETAKLATALLGKQRAARRAVKELAREIEGLVSMRAGTTRAADLHRLNRQAIVKAGVDRAMTMTDEEVGEMFAEASECVIAVTTDSFREALGACVDKRFNEAVVGLSPVMRLSDNCPVLDGVTAGMLIEQAKVYRDHPLAGDMTLAFPLDAARRTSALPLILFDHFVSMPDPGVVHWPDIGKEKEAVTTWRVRLRHCIATSVASREYDISPKSQETGLLIVYMLFSVMERLAEAVSSPAALEFEDTTARMMRGLFGLLLSTLASGTAPLSTVWQMVKPGDSLRVPEEHLWMVERMVRLFPYTKWSPANISKKARQLYVKSLRRYLTDPATEPMRKSLSAIKGVENAKSMAARDGELFFKGVCWEVVRHVIGVGMASVEHDDELRAIGRRLAEVAPRPPYKRNSTEQCRRFSIALAGGLVDWDCAFQHTVKTLTNSYLKHGCPFAEHKARLAADLSKRDEIKASIAAEMSALRSLSPLNVDAKVTNSSCLDSVAKGSVENDPELGMAPWSVSGDKESATKIRATAKRVLSGESVSAAASGERESEIDRKRMTLAETALAPCGDEARSARALIAACREMTPSGVFEGKMSRSSAGAYENLYGLMGWSVGVGPLIEKLVENWRDPVAGEKEAMALLE
nr:hypothetical protein TetV2_00593 [Oceanusvirus sp.]